MSEWTVEDSSELARLTKKHAEWVVSVRENVKKLLATLPAAEYETLIRELGRGQLARDHFMAQQHVK